MQQRGPWRVLDSERRFQNEFLDVVEDRVIRPDGEPGRYATVALMPGVAVLPIGDDGGVQLVREFRYALGAETVETVGGGVEPGEDPLDRAKRELKEEAGIEAAVWEPHGVVDLETSIVRCPVHLFVARRLTFGKPEREGTEAIQPVRVPLAEARAMVLDGRITQAASCVLILRATADGAR